MSGKFNRQIEQLNQDLDRILAYESDPGSELVFENVALEFRSGFPAWNSEYFAFLERWDEEFSEKVSEFKESVATRLRPYFEKFADAVNKLIEEKPGELSEISLAYFNALKVAEVLRNPDEIEVLRAKVAKLTDYYEKLPMYHTIQTAIPHLVECIVSNHEDDRTISVYIPQAYSILELDIALNEEASIPEIGSRVHVLRAEISEYKSNETKWVTLATFRPGEPKEVLQELFPGQGYNISELITIEP